MEEAGDSGRVSKTGQTVKAKVPRRGGSLGRQGEMGDTEEGPGTQKALSGLSKEEGEARERERRAWAESFSQRQVAHPH